MAVIRRLDENPVRGNRLELKHVLWEMLSGGTGFRLVECLRADRQSFARTGVGS